MELGSKPFRDAVSKIFETNANIVATVHVFANPFTDRLKRREDVERIPITHASRNDLPQELAERLQVVV